MGMGGSGGGGWDGRRGDGGDGDSLREVLLLHRQRPAFKPLAKGLLEEPIFMGRPLPGWADMLLTSNMLRAYCKDKGGHSVGRLTDRPEWRD